MRHSAPRRHSARAHAAARTPMAAPTHIASLSDLPPHYTHLLLDQFGVLHDGRAPYPGAVAAVSRWAAAGKTMVVLSNSSRRAATAVSKLADLGFGDALSLCVTSGEVAHARLAARPDGWWRGLGDRVLHITWSARGAVSLDGLGLTVADPDDLASVDFILAHGTEAVALPDGSARELDLDAVRGLLQRAAARPSAPPFLCANPDLATVDGTALRTMPGTLAAWYGAAGGEVVLLGKPGPDIYKAALALAGDPPPSSVLAVGDSLEHDIAGASATGIDALFIGGGIHREELGVGPPVDGASVDGAALGRLLAGRPPGQTPRYVKAYLAP